MMLSVSDWAKLITTTAFFFSGIYPRAKIPIFTSVWPRAWIPSPSPLCVSAAEHVCRQTARVVYTESWLDYIQPLGGESNVEWVEHKCVGMEEQDRTAVQLHTVTLGGILTWLHIFDWLKLEPWLHIFDGWPHVFGLQCPLTWTQAQCQRHALNVF